MNVAGAASSCSTVASRTVALRAASSSRLPPLLPLRQQQQHRRRSRSVLVAAAASSAGADAAGEGDDLNHPPVALLIARARLEALEAFRAAVAPLRESPLSAGAGGGGGGGGFDLPAALAAVARFANCSADASEARAGVEALAGEVRARAEQMRALQEAAERGDADAAAAAALNNAAAAAAASTAAPWLEEPSAPPLGAGSSLSGDLFGYTDPWSGELAGFGAAPSDSGSFGSVSGWAAHANNSHGAVNGAANAAADSAAALAAEDLSRRLLALVSVMEDAGFGLNHGDPWDPANTYIDTLLERRLGTPRSLALLWLAVAAAAGLPLVPWAFPGGDEVLLKLQLPAGALLLSRPLLLLLRHVMCMQCVLLSLFHVPTPIFLPDRKCNNTNKSPPNKRRNRRRRRAARRPLAAWLAAAAARRGARRRRRRWRRRLGR